MSLKDGGRMGVLGSPFVSSFEAPDALHWRAYPSGFVPVSRAYRAPTASRAYRALTASRAYRALAASRAYRAPTASRAHRALTASRVRQLIKASAPTIGRHIGDRKLLSVFPSKKAFGFRLTEPYRGSPTNGRRN